MLNLFDFECTNQVDKWWWEDDEEQVWTEEMIIDLGFSGEENTRSDEDVHSIASSRSFSYPFR